MLIFCLYAIQCHFGIATLSHPDNALEACAFLTPLHIVPEWYFLCQYALLKAVPNKNGGFLMLLASVFVLFFLGESKNYTTFKRMMTVNNGFLNSLFFCFFVSFVWIGAQFPQEKFLSYARVLTLDYFLVLLLIILSKKMTPL
jgi:ubiquinol-cytochrome c reductase cytochrome b subunit